MCNFTHPHRSLRASSKNDDFYFFGGPFSQLRRAREVQTAALIAPLGLAVCTLRARSAGTLRELPLRGRAFVFPLPSLLPLFFFFPFSSVPIPLPSLHLMSQASFSIPNNLTSLICVSHMPELHSTNIEDIRGDIHSKMPMRVN